jgi:hypothetical protein
VQAISRPLGSPSHRRRAAGARRPFQSCPIHLGQPALLTRFTVAGSSRFSHSITSEQPSTLFAWI